MSRVITFSRTFPAYHPRAGEFTFFVEQVLNSILPKQENGIIDINSLNAEVKYIVNDFAIMDGGQKHHTIRAGNRWKVGDKFSPRVWSGIPRRSKQLVIAPDIEIKKVWTFEIRDRTVFVNKVEQGPSDLQTIAQNDGLSFMGLMEWFKYPQPFEGQIICWSDQINY